MPKSWKLFPQEIVFGDNAVWEQVEQRCVDFHHEPIVLFDF